MPHSWYKVKEWLCQTDGDILETPCGNGVHRVWFPTDSLPLPDTSSVEKNREHREWVVSGWSFFLSSGGKIWWDPATSGLCHDTEKSPSFLLVLEIWHLQGSPGRVFWALHNQLQAQAQSRLLAPVEVEHVHILGAGILLTCPWEVPPNSAPCLKKWHFPQAVSLLTCPHRAPRMPHLLGSLPSPTPKERIHSLSLHTGQPSFRLGLHVSSSSFTWAAVTE